MLGDGQILEICCKVDANRYDVGYDVGKGVEGELNIVWDRERYQASK